MVLFVGSEETGYFVRDVIPEVSYTGYQPDITNIAEDILQESYEYIIFYVEQFVNGFGQIAGTVKRIETASNAKIIIFASGYSPQSEMIQALLAEGIMLFIFSVSLGDMKLDLERCLRGEALPSPASPPEIKVAAAAPVSHYTTVSFAGCCPRMGATTQAIQFIKYLQLLGYRACYIEMNSSGFTERLQALYSVTSHDTDIGFVSYLHVDMYYRKGRISEILKRGYDYYVYDFGNFAASDFDPAFFLEKNISVAVMGSSPNEFDAMENLIRQTVNSDVFYIFNFADKAEQADILELMQDKAGNTLFARYAPDPFVYLSDRNAIYSRILPDHKTSQEQVQKKPRFRFGKRHGHG